MLRPVDDSIAIEVLRLWLDTKDRDFFSS